MYNNSGTGTLMRTPCCKSRKGSTSQPFKRQSHEMVKHTQTIRPFLPTNCLSVFGQFLGLALKVLKCAVQKS